MDKIDEQHKMRSRFQKIIFDFSMQLKELFPDARNTSIMIHRLPQSFFEGRSSAKLEEKIVKENEKYLLSKSFQEDFDFPIGGSVTVWSVDVKNKEVDVIEK